MQTSTYAHTESAISINGVHQHPYLFYNYLYEELIIVQPSNMIYTHGYNTFNMWKYDELLSL
jgi:hypothetical protein